MTITIKINTENDAFRNFDMQINKILENAGKKIRRYQHSPTDFKLLDFNGNTVGTITMDGE